LHSTTNKSSKKRKYINYILQALGIQILLLTFCKLPALSQTPLKSAASQLQESVNNQPEDTDLATLKSTLDSQQARLSASRVRFAEISQEDEHSYSVKSGTIDVVSSSSKLGEEQPHLIVSKVKFASISTPDNDVDNKLENIDVVTPVSESNSSKSELFLSEVRVAEISQEKYNFADRPENSDIVTVSSLHLSEPELILSQVSLETQGTLNPSIPSGGIDPLQLAPDATLDSTVSETNVSQFPSIPSQPEAPNQNVQPGGVDPLQTAPDSRVDQLNPNQPLEKIEGNAELTDVLVRNAIINTAGRYPWIIDPTDRLSFSALLFRPGEKEVYSNFDFQTTDGSAGVNRFSVGVFPKKDSFYWILDNNQIVMETRGELYGVSYQGESKDFDITRKMNLIQSYGGNQFVVALAPDMERLLGNADSNFNNGSNNTSGASILTVAAQLTNPVGVPAQQITINNPAITNNTNNITHVKIPSQSTLYDNIEIANAPKILQAYPTVNLQSLASLSLYRGEEIPESVLKDSGITFGSIFKNTAPRFTPSVSSTAGIKVLQSGRFDNPDLLKMLLDRSISDSTRNVHYLNSLYWSSYGIRGEKLSEKTQSNSYRWYRLYASQAHNRVLLRYDKNKAEATYTQVFANPGISITLRPETFDVDGTQSITNSVGLLTGLIYDQINPSNINKLLATARKRYQNREVFSTLSTKATSEERRQINRRLNSTLAFTNLASGIEQVSGKITFSSRIKPRQSSMWQVRSGLYRRSVLFFESQSTVTSGPITFGETRFSPDRLGPLGFANSFTPESKVDNPIPTNESFAVQTLMTTADGRQFLFQDSSENLLGVPIPARATALVFDRFELRRSETQRVKNYIFSGYKFLPATELVYSGTNKNINYSMSVGTWINPNAHLLLNVSDNQSIFKEPTVGVYANANVNSTNLKISRDAKGNPIEVFNFSPSLTLRLNSSSSVLNQNLVALSSLFFYQNRNFEVAVAPGVQYNDRFIGVLPASLRFKNGLSFETALEVGERTYYRLEALQAVNRDLSLGLYVRNFTDIDRSRLRSDSYGLKMRFNVPKTVLFTDFTIGNSSQGLDIRLQGSMNF
jgi:hypothetical protein